MRKYLAALLIVSASLYMCTKPTTLGTDFIGNDLIDIEQLDTFTVRARTIEAEPIIIYDSLPALSRYLCGNLQDPIFGNSSSEIFGQLRMINLGRDFGVSTPDSIVLSFGYDSTSFAGNFTEEQIDVEVYRVTEDMIRDERYRSDRRFATEMMPLGSKTGFIPNFSDNVTVIEENPEGDLDTLTLQPQLRIPLDITLAEEIMAYDSTTLSTNTNFTDVFKGINVRVNSQNSMMALDLLNGNATRLTLYYKRGDTTAVQFTLGFTSNSPITCAFEHDYSGTSLTQVFNDSVFGDSLLFAQGMSGAEIELDFPFIDTLEDEVINYAALSFTIAQNIPDNDTTLYPPIEQVTGTYLNEDGEVQLCRDAFLTELRDSRLAFVADAFGGFVENTMTEDGQLIQQYTITLTNHIRGMIDGEFPDRLRIRPRLKNVKADRSIVYGPGHSEYPMTLKMILSSQ